MSPFAPAQDGQLPTESGHIQIFQPTLPKSDWLLCHRPSCDKYGQSFYNIIAKINGKNTQLDPILIGAHYDTCGSHPGADDNAAANAIMFQIIDRVKQIEVNRSIIFAFFDIVLSKIRFSIQSLCDFKLFFVNFQ